ncbi:LOW QUALITY PROTEIN: uncharacterized protein LOC133839156 [Drosophila sulfurigaster albostrigata]|uniref:LOW QUALITY PROTEIN: uncharacterized protein LOC133839156 n=1 Tax=Drosophila sulfurigaster albostrigata TaxID=89887 RepID=UPI002D2185A7|nr:LOW QUALITY PROTEIN: uncharacterized protein LOC133839156 [Drosophila sulfurigaster albostrigata]
MPFVQRVVQPVNVAQATAASLGQAATRFQCSPGKCKNNNCINKQTNNDVVANNDETDASMTRALVHNVTNCDADDEPRPPAALPMKKLKQHVEFLPSTSSAASVSASTSPTRTSQSLPNSRHASQQRAGKLNGHSSLSAPHSPTASGATTRVISGYEFDSISNITLSNALRQLASLVLIASDIFDDLQRDLQSVGERAGRVQRKILAVERRVCAYDPKMVTVPESDLLTFAQRKQHFDSDKSFQQELFTQDSRPHSVRQLYKDAGKQLLLMPMAPTTPLRSVSFNGDVGVVNGEDVLDGSGEAEEQLLCSDLDFGNANRKLRTRIDAEIEIRLPAAIEDLRKWTSSEALGDVTVTPDCMHHVDTSICTSLVIGDNGILTPALSPSVLSADALDAQYAINISQAADSSSHHHHHHHHNHHQQQLLLPNDINKDVPLNHRLPSPEEQTKIIALKYPAEVISVNTSGKHFQRMCAARKSTTGCYAGGAGSTANGAVSTPSTSGGSPEDNQSEANNLDDNVQTVSRRSRSRKVRGKRRNTIAGIDQKEIQDAANGNATKQTPSAATSPAPVATTSSAVDATRKSKKFGRSKSSDLLKKESVALPYDKGKNTLTRLNSLKQWGRNRFKFMQRNGNDAESSQLDTSGCSSQHSSSIEKSDLQSSHSSHKSNHCSLPAPGSGVSGTQGKSKTRDIDDECVVHDLIAQKSESRFSHERKPSYSSSEKSMSVSSSGQLRGKLQLSSLTAAAQVKMRETATLNRQRRNLHRLDAAGKEEQPHSSSGNWSASSESGRASIGSEITMQPKSSASNTSLNVSSFQPCSSSGPPSSMLSRRRFLNTSASSSVTSEGTATPELQADAGAYPNHLDDETSSAYSCDTEGYYTSFHMDSGLRTLKEEEPPMTPLQQSLHTSSYSFGSQSNQTVLNAENEYELYGRGSTSTTTSSAGTVCTTLMLNAVNCVTGPDVPERSSSLGKHSQSQSNSASSSTLERSYSSSTIGSTLERTGTIKRNLKMSNGGEESLQQQQQQDEQRSALPLPQDLEYSECSDLEGVERIERIKQKTTINAKRIPSMCIITPTTSDDDEHQSQTSETEAERTLTNLQVDVDSECETPLSAAELTPTNSSSSKDHNLNELKQTPTKALGSMFEKLRVVLPLGKSSSPVKPAAASAVDDDKLYDLAGEYVTIADISNNNNNNNNNSKHLRYNKRGGAKGQAAASSGNMAIYYSNDIVRRGLKQPLCSEYVSLNELPQHLQRPQPKQQPQAEACAEQEQLLSATQQQQQQQPTESCNSVPMYAEISELREEKSLLGQRRVRTNAEGRIIYDSDSLKRRKGAHTTFAPGPYVKETESALQHSSNGSGSGSATRELATGESATSNATKSAKLLLLNSGQSANRKVANVRPIVSKSPLSKTPPTMATYQQQQQPQSVNNYQEQKQLLANNTNPFYETISGGSSNNMMMASPSSKSNSSTGSTATNSSSSTATTASANSAEEGYQRFSNIYEQVLPSATLKNAPLPTADATPFSRNAPVYWTLQNRRSNQAKAAAAGALPGGNVTTCRDDLYATPIRRADRLARAAASNGDAGGRSNISPIVPRNGNGSFLTSTPTRDSNASENVPPMKQPARNWSQDDAPERLGTCADRIGQSKTTLMDFKKLLLAKSAKTSPVQRKVSAVELLKKAPAGSNNAPAALSQKPSQTSTPGASKPTALNSSLKLLDLSGSPKTFANRRMLRQGQFGSPSKTFAPKIRSNSAAAVASVVPRTDIMSSTILEANSEEDHSNNSGGSRASLEAANETAARTVASTTSPSSVAVSSFDLKRNFFLQTEENNFMRGELKPSFGRTNGAAGNVESNNKFVNAASASLPAFETAL